MRAAKVDTTTRLLSTTIRVKIGMSDCPVHAQETIVNASIGVDNINKSSISLVDSDRWLGKFKQWPGRIKSGDSVNHKPELIPRILGRVRGRHLNKPRQLRFISYEIPLSISCLLQTLLIIFVFIGY